jgi:hypothetical protein
MRLFSYCIPVDDGAAPNPYSGVCTLTICKPVIRRVAEVGDWVVGVGSKNVGGKDYSGKLVYAMRVTQKMSLRKYDNLCRMMYPDKIPDITSSDPKRRLGDCIYDYQHGYEPTLRGSVHGKQNMEKDLRGLNALLSDEFYYFGDAAVDIPADYVTMARQGQGHQSTRNQFIKDKFIQWLQANYQKNQLIGKPQVQVQFKTDSSGNTCALLRCDSADQDEEMNYSEEQLPLSHWQYFLALETDLKTLSRYIEIHESNYATFSIGLTQLFLSTCAECEIVMKGICRLLAGKDTRNMKEFAQVILSEMQSIVSKQVSIPLYGISLFPFQNWNVAKPPEWWTSYNAVKHNRGTHYMEANLKNTLSALGALYILIFELIRIHQGQREGTLAALTTYRHLQPKQELFLLEQEDFNREIGEGKRINF